MVRYLRELGDVQRAVRSLTAVLPPVLQAYQRDGVDELVREGNAVVVRKNLAWAALSRLHDASCEAARVLGDPPRPGRHAELWQMWASSLIDLVSAALAKGGASRLSIKEDGPLVRVLPRAPLHRRGRAQRGQGGLRPQAASTLRGPQLFRISARFCRWRTREYCAAPLGVARCSMRTAEFKERLRPAMAAEPARSAETERFVAYPDLPQHGIPKYRDRSAPADGARAVPARGQPVAQPRGLAPF